MAHKNQSAHSTAYPFFFASNCHKNRSQLRHHQNSAAAFLASYLTPPNLICSGSEALLECDFLLSAPCFGSVLHNGPGEIVCYLLIVIVCVCVCVLLYVWRGFLLYYCYSMIVLLLFSCIR